MRRAGSRGAGTTARATRRCAPSLSLTLADPRDRRAEEAANRSAKAGKAKGSAKGGKMKAAKGALKSGISKGGKKSGFKGKGKGKK